VRARPGGERVAEVLADVWLAEPSDLARAESGVLVTRAGHCFDAERGELWFAGETAEAVLLHLDARRRALAREADELERRAEAAEARRRLEEAGAEPAAGEDRDELAERIERLERRRETLGQVNPLAKEEYEHEKERLTELAAQRADLERSLEELEELRAELA